MQRSGYKEIANELTKRSPSVGTYFSRVITRNDWFPLQSTTQSLMVGPAHRRLWIEQQYNGQSMLAIWIHYVPVVDFHDRLKFEWKLINNRQVDEDYCKHNN